MAKKILYPDKRGRVVLTGLFWDTDYFEAERLEDGTITLIPCVQVSEDEKEDWAIKKEKAQSNLRKNK